MTRPLHGRGCEKLEWKPERLGADIRRESD